MAHVSEQPPNSPNNNLLRALIAGAVLAVFGIGQFVLFYAVIFAGAQDLTRLLVSLLLPPLVMGVLLGVYVLFLRKPK